VIVLRYFGSSGCDTGALVGMCLKRSSLCSTRPR
jgi:hypothetical protein